MMLDRAAIARLVPHAGAMCLLDAVERWDEREIVCISEQHRNERNPLAVDGRLAAVHAIEFAAQAMAVHGALANGGERNPGIGWLASVRDCVLDCDRLDALEQPLRVVAERISAGGGALMYRLSVTSGGVRVLEGRAMVVLENGSA
jgi:predicted hotdog family 3-hydroxylacyl-ACP dehydratase